MLRKCEWRKQVQYLGDRRGKVLVIVQLENITMTFMRQIFPSNLETPSHIPSYWKFWQFSLQQNLLWLFSFSVARLEAIKSLVCWLPVESLAINSIFGYYLLQLSHITLLVILLWLENHVNFGWREKAKPTANLEHCL